MSLTSPTDLGPRGLALWTESTAKVDLDAAGAVILHEACRIADRLEQLDRILRGDVATWAEIADTYDGGKRVTRVVLDDALGEARQQAGSMARLLSQLKLGVAAEKASGEVSRVDQLKAQREERQRRAAASHPGGT